MIQASQKIIMLLVVVAITSQTGRLFADAPQSVLPPMPVQGDVQQVTHQVQPAGEIQPAQCTTESCDSGRCGKSRACPTCDGCEVCKPGIWDRVKLGFGRLGRFGRCDDYGGFNVHCPQCRGLGHYCGRCGRKNRWWIPNGCGGKGCPPFGRYQMVYPVNPQYCDSRDRNVNAAQGYNVPISVPLAPVVRHQYNYSWGVPSSRLTPISNYAPAGLYGSSYGYPGQMPSNYCPSCQNRAGH